MQYPHEVNNQIKKDLHVEFGMEWGLTEPVLDENAHYEQSSEETKRDRTRELARKLKAKNK